MVKSALLRLTEPLLIWFHRRYVVWFPVYRYGSIRVAIPKGVFHPGLVFSTRAMLTYLSGIDLAGRRVLDLGTGSGILAIYCASRGALASASDINPLALEACRMNAAKNNTAVVTHLSDLFEGLEDTTFDLILINPPYYPADPDGMAQRAWFCGSDFGYYHRLFGTGSMTRHPMPETLMVLGETAPIGEIMHIAGENSLDMEEVTSWRYAGERFYIFRLRSR